MQETARDVAAAGGETDVATFDALDESAVDAHVASVAKREDTAAAIALLREDIRVTMPPHPSVYQGIEAVRGLMDRAFDVDMAGRWRLVPTSANRMPAAASYFIARRDDRYRGFKLDVLRVEDGEIVEITTFGPSLFPAFGLPETLS